MSRRLPTRRELLAGLGGTSLVVLAGERVGAAAGLAPVETNRRFVVPSEVPLAVDFRETYNGTVVEGAGEPASGAPAVAVGDALPGDGGTATYVAGSTAAASTSFRLALSLTLEDAAENGLAEPERETGDRSAGEVELLDAVRVELWRDEGVLGTPVGHRNGGREPGEAVLAAGSLREVAAELDDGVTLPREGCFPPDAEPTVSMRWSLPRDVGNEVQGDSGRFAVTLAARPCSRRASV